MLETGSDAIDFELPNQDSVKVRLSDFKGKVVVLYFYPKDDTPGCTAEACSFRDSMEAITKLGAVVLGVSADSIKSHIKFKQKYGLNFNLLSDQRKEVIKAYGADGPLMTRRITYIIDKNQKIAYRFDKVNPNGHAQEVINKIKELNLL